MPKPNPHRPFTPLPAQMALRDGTVDPMVWAAFRETLTHHIAIEEKVLAMLARRHGVAPDDKRAFGHWNMEQEYSKIRRAGVDLAIELFGGGAWFLLRVDLASRPPEREGH